MKKFFSTLILASLLLSSCSSMIDRKIAADAVNDEARAAVDTLFTFKKSNMAMNELDLKETAENNLKMLVYNTKVKVEFIEDSTMGLDDAFKIEPVAGKEYLIKVRYAEDAFLDHPATLNMTRFMDSVLRAQMKQVYPIFEIYYNALNNDAPTLHAVAKLRKSVLTPLEKTSFYPIQTSQYNGYVQGESIDWDKKVASFAKLEKSKNIEKKILTEQRKARMAKLDAAPESKQFRYLVSIGDRQGAADLIEAYLPFEEMAPFEKRYWQTHLEVMRNPAPLSDRVLIFRGIDDDLIQTPVKNGVKLSAEEAVREQDIFVMSTMMTKNQGSWNRRLRSLTSMYEKFIAGIKVNDKEYSDEFAKAARMTVLFKNHAAKPDGSPFLSFTPGVSTAVTFGQKRISGYLIDPRILEYNFTSVYSHEREFLLPLATFPDEIIVVNDLSIHPALPAGQQLEGALHKLVMQNLENKLGPAEGIETYKKISENSKKFFSNMNLTMNFDAQAIKDKSAAKAAEIAKLPKVEPTMAVNTCNDLLKAFW